MPKTMDRSIFLFAIVFSIATVAMGSTGSYAAQWLAPASADRVTADWVKQIQTELAGERFRDLFMGIPADPPVPAILHLLNQASQALADNNQEYAKAFIADAIRILDRGVVKGWYSPGDVEPVKAMIVQRAQAALEGKALSGVTNPRWTGYTDRQRLGLTDTAGERQHAVFPEATQSAPARSKETGQKQ
ncbi:MAG: hypothetical protein AB1555_11710 [Nitrospirota bacterium]